MAIFVIGDLHLEAARHVLGGVHNGLVEPHDVLAGGQLRLGKALRQVGKVGVQAHADGTVGGHAGIQFIHIGHGNLPPYSSLR